MRLDRRGVICGLAASAVAATEFPALAEAYPSRPVRVFVPYQAGGGADIAARSIGDFVGQHLKASFVIENKPGGQTIIASEAVARSAPDGYSLLIANGDTIAIDIAYEQKLPYDPIKDFTYIAGLGEISLVLVCNPSIGVRSLGDLVRKAKQRPGKLTFASLGATSPHFLFFEWFKRTAGIDMIDIPYKGTGQTTVDVVGGHVDCTMISDMSASSYAGDGRLIALAATANMRTMFAPDVKTFSEQGYPELVMSNWYALAGPAQMSPDIVRMLSSAVDLALNDPQVAKRFATIGLRSWHRSPQDVAKSLVEEEQRYSKIVRLTGAKTP